MRAGKRLHIGYYDYEVLTMNGEEYVKLEDVPRIADQLYGKRLIDFMKAAVEGVTLHYDKDTETFSVIDIEKESKDA